MSAQQFDGKVAVPGYQIEPGSPLPLGATPDADGVNFALFSAHATSVELLLFDTHDAPELFLGIALDPDIHRTFGIWHVYVRGLRPGCAYAYRVDGPRDTSAGHRFDPTKVLIDPYAFGNTTTHWDRTRATGSLDNVAAAMRSTVIDTADYDWQGDQPLKRPLHETIIYELHVGGFTRAPSSGCTHPGTFAAIIEKIPYLQALGVTAVELLPVCQFDPQDVARSNPLDGSPLTDFWGYNTVSFFAPHPFYCVAPDEGTHLREFRDMVKALHQAGIEVILDMVFNHTSEGNQLGPTISFRGLDNRTYYDLVPSDRQYYMDYTGTGNTFNCNHPVVAKLILDCLEFWVREMHVDGFRFDEGTILTRGPDGALVQYPPVVWAITMTPALASTKVIAEAWDAGGLYEVGTFPGYRWAEWNGRYRDDIRRFVRGDRGLIGSVASRIAGSSDLYQPSGRLPTNSINFITCHDGFTLYDLVAYNTKHNQANGEGNRDGIDNNLSWNCGVEGPADDPAIEALRLRQIKNFAAILLLSQGVPMLRGGDEVGQTQGGNNNVYCQDNPISWLSWDFGERERELLRFFQRMIALRRMHPALQRGRFFSGAPTERGLREIAWHGCRLNQPGWNDPASGVLAFTLAGSSSTADLHVMINMEDRKLGFDVPALDGRSWHRVIDTALPSPADIVDLDCAAAFSERTYSVDARSLVLLASR